MAEKFEDVSKAVEHLEKKMDEFKAATTKESAEKALAEAKSIVEKSNKDFEATWEARQTELIKKDATILDLQGEVKELKAKSGRIRAGGERTKVWLGDLIAGTIAEKKAEIMASEHGGLLKGIEVKAVNIQSSALSGTGNNYTTYLDWQPGMEPTGQYRFRQLVRTIQSETDFVRFPRANTPVGAGSFSRITEQATKTQLDRGYTMIDLTLKPMAGYSIVSRQSLRNIVFLQSWLPTSLMEQLQDSEDTDFANALIAAATGSTTATGITVNVEKIIYYIKNLIAAKYNPTGVAMDPTPWASLLVTKPNDYSLPNVVTVDANGNVRILGRVIYPVNWLTGGRIIVGDWSRAAIIQSEGLMLRQSDSHASIFTSNELAFLLERTENLAIFRPDAFITTTLS